jgi:putative endonuclease
VLRSGVDPARYYAGSTSNGVGRLAAYTDGICRHTSNHRPWELHVVIRFPDERLALAFERYLKRGRAARFPSGTSIEEIPWGG